MRGDERDDAFAGDQMRLLLQVAATEDAAGVHHPSRLAQEAKTQAAQDAVMSGLRELEHAGLLAQKSDRSIADDKWILTLAGRSAVRRLQNRRDHDPAGRNLACRKAIIAWLARVADRGAGHGDWEDFTQEEGNEWAFAPYPERAIDRAAAWLADQGYLTGHYVAEMSRPLLPSITSRGESWYEEGAPMAGQSSARGDRVATPAAPVEEASSMSEPRLHVQLTSGKGLTGTSTASLWDLTEEALEQRVLQPRRSGGSAWFSGREFSWDKTKVAVYEGPATSQIENFVGVMGPGILAFSGSLHDVTDRYITGPAGVGGDAPGQPVTFVTDAPPQPIADSSTTETQASGATANMKRYQVFLSSTFRDLGAERQAVTHALLRMGRCIPAGMELFTASSLPPWQYIQRVLDVTDYVILVIGDRYGSLRPGGDLSYTELEYNYALEHEIPVIPFIPDDRRLVLKSNLDEGEEAQRRRDAFIERLRGGHHTRTWTDEGNLADQVKDALYYEFDATPRPGWIRGTT